MAAEIFAKRVSMSAGIACCQIAPDVEVTGATVRDPSEFLDVDVDELARARARSVRRQSTCTQAH